MLRNPNIPPWPIPKLATPKWPHPPSQTIPDVRGMEPKLLETQKRWPDIRKPNNNKIKRD